MCTSLTQLNKNIHLRMDNRLSNGAAIHDDSHSKVSSNRGETINLIQTNSISKNSGKGGLRKAKVISPIKNNQMIQSMAVNSGHLTINSIGKTAQGGVSFTKNKLSTNKFEYAPGGKNMNIHESMGSKTIGLSSKLKMGSTNESSIHHSKVVSQISGHYTNGTRVASGYVSKTA